MAARQNSEGHLGATAEEGRRLYTLTANSIYIYRRSFEGCLGLLGAEAGSVFWSQPLRPRGPGSNGTDAPLSTGGPIALRARGS